MHDEHETNEHALSAELAAFERQLASLVPAAPRVDRDRLMFAAGVASVQPGRLGLADPSRIGKRFWQGATALATAASLMLATMLVWQRAEREQAVAISSTESSDSHKDDSLVMLPMPRLATELAPNGYLRMRQVALAGSAAAFEDEVPANDGNGIDVWSPPATARQLRDELLPELSRSSS